MLIPLTVLALMLPKLSYDLYTGNVNLEKLTEIIHTPNNENINF